jgi:hypothetical protein
LIVSLNPSYTSCLQSRFSPWQHCSVQTPRFVTCVPTTRYLVNMPNTSISETPSEVSPLLRDDGSDGINNRDTENGQLADDHGSTRVYSDRKMNLLLAAVGIGVRILCICK